MNDYAERFADILKQYRKDNNLSQAQLADKLGISRNYLSQIECLAARNLSFALGIRILNLPELHETIKVTLSRRVEVDASIAHEIVWLNSQHVTTIGCCVAPPTAIILPSGVEAARRLGYEPRYDNDHQYFEIELKSR